MLLALAGLVHVTGSALASAQSRAGRSGKARSVETPPAVIRGTGALGLPPAVLDMRAAIIAAVETGDIAELKGAMDLNELKPEFGGPVGVNPIDHLKSMSADGSGKDVLALLGGLLEGGWAAIPGGRDIENNRIYVWPDFAEVPLAGLSETERAAIEGLVGAEPAKTMLAQGRWTWWRLSIGADGVWHMFSQVK